MIRVIQLTVNLVAFDTWMRLMYLDQPLMPYTTPGNGMSVAKDARVANIGGLSVDVDLAISNTTPPPDRTRLIAPTTVMASDSVIVPGVFVIPAGFSVYARLTAYGGYDTPSVIVQASVMERT